jgi:beta-lactamase class A
MDGATGDRADTEDDAVRSAVHDAVSSTPHVEWSIHVRTVSGALVTHRPQARLRTASVGKVILLIEVARRIEADPSYAGRLLARRNSAPIADSGLLQRFRAPELAVADLAVLVGSVSDNWATNVLLADIGLDAVAGTGRSIGLRETVLLDRVRRPRGPGDPPALSYGTAAELCDLMVRLRDGDLLTTGIAGRVELWLAAGVDLSMVGSALGFDPLSHAEDDRGLRLVNKTGTDSGIRADVGHLSGPAGSAAYAVLANWDASRGDRRDDVLDAMRGIGRALRDCVASQ